MLRATSSRPTVMPWLDLMRFVAAFLVMLAHARTLVFVRYGELDPDSQGLFTALGFAVTRFGNEAVVLFFVLSGYLVGGRLWQRCREGTFDARLYAIDRISRIMLPLLAVLICTLLLRRWIEHDWFLEEFFTNIFSLQGITLPELGYNHPLWSLPYEVWCYIMALGMGLLWTGRYVLGGALAVASVTLFVVYLVPWYTVVWLMGAGIYHWRNQFKCPWILFAAVVISIYGWISFQFSDGLFPDSWIANSPLFLGYYKSTLVLGLGFSLLVHQLAQMPPSSKMGKKINRAGHWLAASSYSLYLSHFVVLEVIDWKYIDPGYYVELNSMFELLWVIVMCQTVAFMMYMLSEMHTDLARRWLRKLFPARKEKPQGTALVQTEAA